MNIGFISSVALGYLSGSILYARIFSRLLGKGDAIDQSKDRNPGTANAFMHGGFLCGILTLVFDLLKGFLPVFIYMHGYHSDTAPAMCTALVMAAPVIGHVFPLFYRFKGGKGIAVTFGCLIGLLPNFEPILILVLFFVLFSVVIRISPHYARTIVTYISTLIAIMLSGQDAAVRIGVCIISAAVLYRLHTSCEVKERIRVKLL